jgi:splicing factor 3A subunit 3
LQALSQKIVAFNEELQSLAIDADGTLGEELTRMRTNPLDTFYAQLSSTVEYYEKFPHLQYFAPDNIQPQAVVEDSISVAFSGEEVFGKYLDLNPLFSQFCNVMKAQAGIEQDYMQYLDRFSSFFYIPEKVKRSKGYHEYLQALLAYLQGFYYRVHPLVDLSAVVHDWEQEFAAKVSSGDIVIKGAVGTTATTTTTTATTGEKSAPQPLRLGMFNDVSELEVLGLDRLKEALEALGLKCGGTLHDRAVRLWSVRGKKAEEIPANLKAKVTTSTKKSTGDEQPDSKPLVEKVRSDC